MTNGRNNAQSLVEYALVLAVVFVAIVGMQVYFKGALQGRLKESVERIGTQFSPRWSRFDVKTVSHQHMINVVNTDDIKAEGAWTTSTIDPDPPPGMPKHAFTVRTGIDGGGVLDDFSGKALNEEELFESSPGPGPGPGVI